MSERVQLTPTQQAAAVDRVGENLALVSGAGCGKTLVLARRFVQLLLRSAGDREALTRFVALTFTDKAAVEMASRVREILLELADQARGDQRRRLLGWLEDLPGARISTIHSFCASVLRTCAIDAALDPGFRVCADPTVTEMLLAEAADEAVLAAIEAGHQDAAELLAYRPYQRIVEHVGLLVGLRGTVDPRDYADAEATLAGWRESFQRDAEQAWADLCADETFARRLAELDRTPCSDPGDKLAIRREIIASAVRAMLDDPAARTAENFQLATARVGGVGSAKAWGKDVPKAVRNQIKRIVAQVKPLGLYAETFGPADRRAAGALAALTRLAENARGLYDRAKRSRGWLDFDDLLDLTGRLLADRPALAAALSEQIDQLLIDECQDTDSLQISLLARLVGAGEGGAPRPRPGRLFVVGDAKQSIYRFRGAQVEVFEDLCRRLGEGARENLDLSFRTHDAGVAFINHLFAAMMGDDYAPIRAHRAESPPQASVEIIIASDSEDYPVSKAASASLAQAAATAQRIREMLDGDEQIVWDRDGQKWRPAAPGDIAVLLARMTGSADYERELQARGIPYHVLAGTGFFRQQEIFDVLNALRVIDNPRDDVAFFGVLRSSLFGLDDNSLMHLAETCDRPYLANLSRADLDDRLAEDQLQSLLAASDLLGRLHRTKDALGIGEVLARLLDATGFEAVLLSQFQGRRMLGNVRLLVQRARAASADGVPLADFITQMNEMVLHEARYEQAAVAAETEGVVRIMTIHKAKGLQFPIVFVPDLNAGHRDREGDLLGRIDWPMTYKLPADDDDAEGTVPLAWRAAALRETGDRRREDVRRLYVAATRHQDHLVFVGADMRTKDGAFKASGSYLAQMDDVLSIARAIDDGASEIPYAGDRFSAALRAVKPKPPRSPGGRAPRGHAMLQAAAGGADLAGKILNAAKGKAAPPLLGTLGPGVGRVELAVTALSEFEHCPMLYQWRYELRVPPSAIRPAPPGPDADRAAAPVSPTSLDPATTGTLLHRCMELLDFGRPQAAAGLIGRAMAEMDLHDTAEADRLADELDCMLRKFRQHPLYAQLAGAGQAFRELDFVLAAGSATLRGQIDLLYQDQAGCWHVVDYKSDRLGAADAAEHAGRYELQMLAYALAVSRQMGRGPTDATLYFLRPAETHTFAMTAEALSAADERIAALADRLAAARRTGQFDRHEGPACVSCPFGPLCGVP